MWKIPHSKKQEIEKKNNYVNINTGLASSRKLSLKMNNYSFKIDSNGVKSV